MKEIVCAGVCECLCSWVCSCLVVERGAEAVPGSARCTRTCGKHVVIANNTNQTSDSTVDEAKNLLTCLLYLTDRIGTLHVKQRMNKVVVR